MTAIRIPYQSRDEWLSLRARGVGGSDAAAAMGLNPYTSPLALYLEKRGEAQPDDLLDNEAVRWGNVLEDVIADEYSRRTGRRVRRVNQILQHPEHPWMLASLDRDVVGEDRILEVKTAGVQMASLWGEEGTDAVPAQYLIQAMHYLAVTGAAVCDIAVLIGGRDFRIYKVERDDELIATMIQIEGEFWSAVQAGIPPDPRSLSDVIALFPQARESVAVEADEMTVSRCRELAAIKAEIKALEDASEVHEIEIKRAIGDAARLMNGGEEIATWKSVTSSRFDSKRFAADHPDLDKQYRTTSESRRFLLKLKGAKS